MRELWDDRMWTLIGWL